MTLASAPRATGPLVTTESGLVVPAGLVDRGAVSGGGSSGGILVYDTFDEASDINLVDHTPNIGGPWRKNFSSPWVSGSFDLRIEASDNWLYTSSTFVTAGAYLPKAAEADIDITFNYYHSAGGGSLQVAWRSWIHEITGYDIFHDTSANLLLRRLDDGTPTTLYTIASSLSEGNPSVRVKMVGSAITVWYTDILDTDTPVYEGTDTTYPDPGYVQVFQYNTGSAIAYLQDIEVTELAGGLSTVPYTPGLLVHFTADDLDADYSDGDTLVGTVPNGGAELPFSVNGGMTYETAELNGHSAVRFNGTDGYLSTGDREGNPNTAMFIACVARIRSGAATGDDDANNYGPVGVIYNVNTRAAPSLWRWDGDRMAWWDHKNGWKDADDPVRVATFGTYYVFGWRFDQAVAGLVDHYWDGVKDQSDAVTSVLADWWDFYRIGFDGKAYFDGDVCEVLIFDHAPSDEDADAVFAYLNAKYTP